MLRIGNKPWWIGLEWKLQDAWIGVFWTRKPARYATASGEVIDELHVYICLVPCVPVHLVFGKAVPHA